MKNINTLWGNAFQKQTHQSVIYFTAGKDVIADSPADYSLLPYDIWVNKAHCLMLYKQKIIAKTDAQVILKGLNEIEKLTEQNMFSLNPTKEDVHTNIEAWLIEKYGIESAGKLHTARSRNDQCSADTRLYLRDQSLYFIESTLNLINSLLVLSDKYKNYLIPGFTHHQHAMITTFGHILLSFASALMRDVQKFSHWYPLHNTNPLGSSVAYGTSFPIDSHYTSSLLGFDSPDINSLDEITNRWEAEADLGYAVVSLMNHLSLIAQTLILFSTPQFGMIKLSDDFSTGSSIMPQKKILIL